MYKTEILRRKTPQAILKAIGEIAKNNTYVSFSEITPLTGENKNHEIVVVGFETTVNSSNRKDILELINDPVCDTSRLTLENQYKPKNH